MLAQIIKWHRRLAWVAGIALIAWGLSGMLHPIMSWISVKPMSYMPPVKEAIAWDKIRHNPDAVMAAGQDISFARIVMLSGHPALQMTGRDGGRQIMALDDGNIIDEKSYAVSLAQYYSGAKESIKDVHLITEYSRAYPPNNRFLPVWRVSFDRPDGLKVYVDTSNDKLGTITTNLKVVLLSVFQIVHTLDFLEPIEALRVLTIGFLMLSIMSITGFGIALISKLKRPRIPNNKRGWHRRLAYIAWLPALTFSMSGFFHLLASTSLQETMTKQIIPAVRILPIGDMRSKNLSQLKLISDTNGQSYWMEIGAKPSEIFLRSAEGRDIAIKDFARQRVAENLQIALDKTNEVTLVTKFSAEYGFINKRLPVWRVSSKGKQGTCFYDATDNVIVACNKGLTQSDNWFFANFHKWQFMNPIGLVTRDLLMIGAVMLLITISALGLFLLKRRPVLKSHK